MSMSMSMSMPSIHNILIVCFCIIRMNHIIRIQYKNYVLYYHHYHHH